MSTCCWGNLSVILKNSSRVIYPVVIRHPKKSCMCVNACGNSNFSFLQTSVARTHPHSLPAHSSLDMRDVGTHADNTARARLLMVNTTAYECESPKLDDFPELWTSPPNALLSAIHQNVCMRSMARMKTSPPHRACLTNTCARAPCFFAAFFSWKEKQWATHNKSNI